MPIRFGCSSSTSGTAESGIKKTPWTLSEDSILREYVKKHGEGNWGSIQEISGLDKSGKSCRNRWANYLRPNLKKGALSAEEEKLIIELHGQHGNRWAHIAAQLQGRTDNDVKNYWNMRVKKCQRAGLAIRPQKMRQINRPLNSSPLTAFSSHLASFQLQDPNLLCLSPSPKYPNELFSSPTIVTSTLEPFSSDNVIATPINGAGDFEVMKSEFMQGPENQDSWDDFRFIDEELLKLLDIPLSTPLPEWDDLDPDF